MVGIPSLGKDEVIDASVSRLPEAVGCEEMVVVDKLSVEWIFELEEVVEVLEGVRVAVVIKPVAGVTVVPEVSEDGPVGVRKLAGVDVSLVETKVMLSDIEYVVRGLGTVT